MTAISVTALAQAGQSGKLHPTYIPSFWYPQGQPVQIWPPDFVDDITSDLMAALLGGIVVKLQPRELWFNGGVNNNPNPNLPTQNFVSFAGQPNAPNPGDLLIVNCGDLVNQACVGYSFGLPSPLGNEQAIAYIIQGATMSPDALAALPTSPISSWPASPVYWYTPPAQAKA